MMARHWSTGDARRRAARRAPGTAHRYRWANAPCSYRNGYPRLRMATASYTPEYRSCSWTIGAVYAPARLSAFGLTQRM